MDDKEERKKEMISPDCDNTPLLGSKLPQLRLVCFPVYEVVDFSIRVIDHVYLCRSSASMSVEEHEGTFISTSATVFIRWALKLFMAGVVSEALATPFGC